MCFCFVTEWMRRAGTGSVVTEAFLTVSWKSPAPIVTLESPLVGTLGISEKDHTYAFTRPIGLSLSSSFEVDTWRGSRMGWPRHRPPLALKGWA